MTNRFRSEFPIFNKYPELAYLDNAATTQRPSCVIESISDFYSETNSNIHRGVYDLSNDASRMYEDARNQVAEFFGAKPDNIAFTKGTTESLNIIASSYLRNQLEKGDNVVSTIMEHHSNFIPWQQLAAEKGADFRVTPILENGDLDLKALDDLLDSKTKMLAVTQISNTLGTINDLNEIISLAHKKGIPVTIDAAQGAALYDPSAEEFNYDFMACSGHKMFGPFGIGVLFVSDEYKNHIEPFNYGGGMIQSVGVEETSFAKYPKNLEAGTPNVGGAIGLSTALRFINGLDRVSARTELSDLAEYCNDKLNSIDGISVIANPSVQTGIVSFRMDGIHPHDVASMLNKDGIAVRAGMHCTQPLLEHLGVHATLRASFSIYNSSEEVDRLVNSLNEIKNFWA